MKFVFTIICIIFLSNHQDEYAGLRNQMVETQIKARGVKDTNVLEAMKKVPRHLFVPSQYQSAAYKDRPLPIGQNQTISQPYIVAYMTEAIGPEADDVVLEIGTGSGYQAAVLAEIVKTVYTLEIIPELGMIAKEKLKILAYDNIEAKVSDGYYGWKEFAPFDAIVVTAAAEKIPEPLIEQLKEGGKMIIPVGSANEVQHLVLLTKKNGEAKIKNLFPVRFVPFTRD